MPVLRFAGCLAGFFVPVCVAGAALCLCACFYGLAGAGCHCVRLSVGVCALLRCVCGALSVPVMAGFALCGAVGVCRCCAGCAYRGVRCGAVCVILSIKTRVYSVF